MVEKDETLRAPRALAGDALEEAFSLGRILEHEGRCEEDWRLERALRQDRIETVAHHQRRRTKFMVADGRARRFRAAAGRALEVGHLVAPVTNALAVERRRR